MVNYKHRRGALGAGRKQRRPRGDMWFAKAISVWLGGQTGAINRELPRANSSYYDTEQETSGVAADSGYETSPAYQDDEMGSAPLPLLDLHHSADNHEPSPYDTTLVYPSGHIERFSFGKRLQKREHKYSRTLKPCGDLIKTIEVISIQSGINTHQELEFKRRILETAFENREGLAAARLPSFQTLVQDIPGWKTNTKLQCFGNPLRPELVEHFFDQCHDRSIADVASLLERTGEKSRESTYGELTPRFLSTLFLQTGLTTSCTYLDLGSGVGQTCMQASLEMGCTSFGIEREGKCHTVAMTHLRQFEARSTLYGLEHGDVHLRKGDFLSSVFVDELLGKADVVLVNNLKLGPETDLALQAKLTTALKRGTRVISTRPLAPIQRPARAAKVIRKQAAEVNATAAGVDELVERQGQDDMWTWNQYIYTAGSVSWSHKKGLYYISVRR